MSSACGDTVSKVDKGEVQSHTGLQLAKEFASILDEFNISGKVSIQSQQEPDK